MITCTCIITFLMGHCTLIPEYMEIFDEVRQSISITAIQLVVNAYTCSMN